MNDIVRNDIIEVLGKAAEAFGSGDFMRLRELSDTVIHNVSIFQDEDSISIAVIIYTLSKVFREGEKSDPKIRSELLKARESLQGHDYERYKANINRIFGFITKTSNQKNLYFNEVLERSEIKKGSKMFYHGISLGRVAETLGLSRWDLMDYVGKTTISESYEYETDIKKKLYSVRRVFGL